MRRRHNPHAKTVTPVKCQGCSVIVTPGRRAWLSDKFGGWFCSKECERALWTGRSAGRRLSEFDQRELARGAQVELEHTPDRGLAMRIAADHLTEDPFYYRKLATIHSDDTRRMNPFGPVEVLRPMLPNSPRARRNFDFPRAPGTHVSPEELVRAIRAWWKTKEAEDWGDLSYSARFWTPEEWARKGESFGNKAPVNLTSEGNFNRILCYTEGRDQMRLVEEWNRLIESLGWWWETNTCWAFSFYPKKTANPRRGHRNAGSLPPECSVCGAVASFDVDGRYFCDECRVAMKRRAAARRAIHLSSWSGRPDHRSELGGGYRSEGQGYGSAKTRNPRRNATCPKCGAKDAYVSPFSGKLDCRCANVACAECGMRDHLRGKCPTCGGIYCSAHECITHTECFACGVAMTARTGGPCGGCGEVYCWTCYGKADPEGEVCSRCYTTAPNPRLRR